MQAYQQQASRHPPTFTPALPAIVLCSVLTGTSVAAVLATASVSTVSFAAHGLIDLPAALLIFPPAMLLAPLGARCTSRLDCNALKRLLGFFLLAAAPMIPLKAWLFAFKAEQQAAADGGAVTPGGEGQPLEGSSGSEGDGWAARLVAGMPPAPLAAVLVATGGVAGFAGGLLGIGPAMISEWP